MARRAGNLFVCLMLAAVACEVDRSIVVPPDPAAPPEVPDRPGIFRLTFHRQADLYPVWLDSVTVGYQSRQFLPYEPDDLLLLARSIRGGIATEQQRRFRLDGGAGLVVVATPRGAGGTFVAFWERAFPAVHLCGGACDTVAAVGVRVYRVDGAGPTDSLFRLPQWRLANARITDSGSTTDADFRQVRIAAADEDARDRFRNPFGPAFRPGATEFYLSHGGAIYRGSGDAASTALDSVTTGAYPTLSPDGATLVFERAILGDSTAVSCVAGGLKPCLQETTSYVVDRREVWVHDVASGDERLLIEGSEPAFDPLGGRVVVVRPGGLDWVRVSDGAVTPLPNTAGAHSPAVSPDGQYVAFVAEWSGQPDVYFTAIGGS